MDTRTILRYLYQERNRLNQAIAAIEAIGSNHPAPTRGRPRGAASGVAAPAKRRRHRISAAGRKRLSEMMKQRWAERKKKAAKNA